MAAPGSRQKNTQLLRAAKQHYAKAAARALEAVAQQVENEAKLSMQGPQPSSPGTPPAVGGGHLQRSITHEVDKNALRARVGTNNEYARIQELGGVIRAKGTPLAVPYTDDRGRKRVARPQQVTLPPRPYLRPALAKAWRKAPAILKEKFRSRGK